MYKLRDKIIAVVSNEPWGDIWYSKHNWAFELSQTNRVFFLNPAGSWKFSNLFNPELHSEKISDGLEVLTYANRFPLSRFSMIRKLNEKSTARQLKKRLKLPGKELLFWSFDPYRLVDPKALEATNSLYFITDDFTNELEKELVKNVDCLITVSPVLSAKYPAKNTLTLAHGISSEEFRADPDPETQNGILYIGNIDHRIDYQLLIKLILAFPEEQFYFIGKLGSNNNPGFRELFIDKKYPNLIHRPPVHFKRLKQHIAGAKVCLAIMQTEVAGNNINHHKLLQYLAQGKPVLSPVFEDYSEHTELILGYKNPEEAISLLQQAIEVPEYSELIQNRITFAQKHTYPKLINQIEQFLTETECFYV
ncbi:MAG: hypothetical protein KDD41_10295 [Flavobacteriales bacterium]|nr:hypothetical protein [Flavobacteriales bacterium]